MTDKANFSLTLDQISKAYAQKKVLDHIQFQFHSNAIFGIIGANGAGKSTLLEILVGLKSSDSGGILLEERKMPTGIEKSKIGYAGQIPVLWNKLTCEEHSQILGRFYDLPKEKLKKNSNKIWKDFQLQDYKNIRIENLSGGLKQRLNLALSVIHNPRILIWDEPTTGLDIDSKLLLRNYLLDYTKENNAITILSSHDLYELEKLCSQFILLKQGSIIASGNLSQMIQSLPNKIPKLLNPNSIHLEDIYSAFQLNPIS